MFQPTQKKTQKKRNFNSPHVSSVHNKRQISSRPQQNNPRQFNQNPRPQRTPRKQQIMEVDYDLFVKKATPQAIEDYTPTNTFELLGLNSDLILSLKTKGYLQPTPIQDKAIKHILNKKDIIGIANTGTGKTAAFLLPLVHQVAEDLKKTVLILAPTRELANQIYTELKSFVNNSHIRSTLIIGGENIDKQIRELSKPKNFIIATTGRGLDLIEQGELKIQNVDTIVLDEMDQMLDMGFISDIRKILKRAVKCNHLLFFSATSTPNINKIANELLTNPVTVSVVKGLTTDNVNQDVIEIFEGESKFEKLVELLNRDEVKKAIVFENMKHSASKLEKELIKQGFKALAIHGNKNQNQRTRALDAFKSGAIKILIATNVAARGLDIPLVSHVINYSLPPSREDYIHRIGRTGRAGEVGNAYTFVEK
jgi:ATP-dependent RNA helicase RhlE